MKQIPNYSQIPNFFIDKYMSKCSPKATSVYIYICRKTIGWHKMTEQISQKEIIRKTGLTKPSVKKAIKELIDFELIKQNEEVISRGFCYTYDLVFDDQNKGQADYPSKDKGQGNYPISEIRGKNITPHEANKGQGNYPLKESKDKETELKEKTLRVFQHWNSEKVIVHSKLTNDMSKKIKAYLKDYDEDVMKKAISNYSLIYKQKEYFWTKKWTLIEFLSRGLYRFNDEALPFENYKTFSKPQEEKTFNERMKEFNYDNQIQLAGGQRPK